MLQDRAGFLWVGTQDGLYRYDGNHFNAFTTRDGLPGTRIEALHESEDGTLWVSTDRGFGAPRLHDRFESVALNGRAVIGRQGISSDRNGHLYLATNLGLAIGDMSKTGATLRPVEWPEGLAPAGRGVSASVYTDASGLVWFSCGLDLCELNNRTVTDLSAAYRGLPPDRWDAILGDPEENSMGPQRHRALSAPQSGSAHFRIATRACGIHQHFPDHGAGPRGTYLLAPTNRGLMRQATTGWELIDAEQGVTSNDISTVFQDREGSVWLGLLGSGSGAVAGLWRMAELDRVHEGLSRESVWSIHHARW